MPLTPKSKEDCIHQAVRMALESEAEKALEEIFRSAQEELHLCLIASMLRVLDRLADRISVSSSIDPEGKEFIIKFRP